MRGQTNNTDDNILLRKMVSVVRNKNKFARGGTLANGDLCKACRHGL